MWLFCKRGFFSAVRHNDKPDTILIRARVKSDLERLAKAHGYTFKVAFSSSADYSYRTEIPQSEWAKIVASEAEAIDYGNFKNAVHDGTGRDDAYMEVWSAMRGLQDGCFSR